MSFGSKVPVKSTLTAGVVVATIGALLVLRSSASTTTKSGSAPAKKLIEVGWDAPFPDFLKNNLATMEQRPYNGTMVNLHAGKTFLNKTAYPDGAFTQDRADLAAVAKAKKLNHNFVTMWSAREDGWDWFNDADWAAAEANARNFAKTAKAGNFKGIMFDPEPYGTNPWSYSAKLYPKRAFVSVQAKLRQRGAAFMKAVQGEMPDVKILMLFNASIVRVQALDRGSTEKAEWALYASFIDGMLDVIRPTAELIDGNELSYYNVRPSDFDAYPEEKRASRDYVSPENRNKYDKQVKVGHAVFVDGTLNIYKSPRFFGFYLQNDDERRQFLESNTFHALRTSDEYVWVYNENMDWWGSKGKGVQLPTGLEALIARASQKANAGQPLGLSIDSFVKPAIDKYNAKVEIDGRVTTKGLGEKGTGLADVALTTEFTFDGKEMACQLSQADGYYQCFVPPNWSGRITPSLKGYSFNPPYFQANNASKAIYDAHFEATKQ